MNTDSIRTYIEKNFSERRKIHTEGVRQTAVKLAEKYGVVPSKAELAALFHDMYRGVSVDVLNYYVKHLGLDAKYIDNANLAHGKIAAIIMERDYGVTDPDIINAVSYHTTGRAGMSQLEKVIYIADAIEPNRRYPGVEELRKVVWEDLDQACLMSINHTINYVSSQGHYLDPDTLMARDDFMKRRNGMNNKEYALLAAKTLSDKKAADIAAIDIAEKASFADYLVVATGNSDRQVNSLIDDVEDAFAKNDLFVKNIEGRQGSGWVLMDFGDIIVNIFTKEMREKYGIEKVWGDCTFLDIEE
ncbi:MAG: bis(5'-nucleosyl)-tetraphosphatase (symmetrical) YqeK [Firmicutes bacterium]|nr:bis(5'-nucleosyl)-tetraphosphatase (symmetrical) YqeK [Bacillota bacterium]